MSLTTGAVTPTASSTVLITIPNGPCQVVISNTSGSIVYVGAGPNAVTATNGFAIPNNAPPVTFTGYPGSKGTTLNVIAPGTITGVVSWAISTSQ